MEDKGCRIAIQMADRMVVHKGHMISPKNIPRIGTSDSFRFVRSVTLCEHCAVDPKYFILQIEIATTSLDGLVFTLPYIRCRCRSARPRNHYNY